MMVLAFNLAVAELCGIAVIAVYAGAMSQPTRADEPPPSEIVVQAPRTLPAPAAPGQERDAHSGAPVVTTTVRISALYGDLDLTQPAHAARLMTRVGRVAHNACATLDRLYPLTPDPDCVDRAVANATPVAKAIIIAAADK